MKKGKESKSILEVRAWKKAVAKETQKLKGDALLAYFNLPAKSKTSKAA